MFIMNVVQVGTKLGQEMNDDDISHAHTKGSIRKPQDKGGHSNITSIIFRTFRKKVFESFDKRFQNDILETCFFQFFQRRSQN